MEGSHLGGREVGGQGLSHLGVGVAAVPPLTAGVEEGGGQLGLPPLYLGQLPLQHEAVEERAAGEGRTPLLDVRLEGGQRLLQDWPGNCWNAWFVLEFMKTLLVYDNFDVIVKLDSDAPLGTDPPCGNSTMRQYLTICSPLLLLLDQLYTLYLFYVQFFTDPV